MSGSERDIVERARDMAKRLRGLSAMWRTLYADQADQAIQDADWLETEVAAEIERLRSPSPSSPEQGAVLREALEKQLRFAIENLEGIRDGTDIPSMVIIRKSRKLLDRLSSSGTQGEG